MTKFFTLVLMLIPALVSAQNLQQIIMDGGGKRRCDGKPSIIQTYTATQDIIIRRVETWIGTNGGNPFPAVDVYTTVDAKHPAFTGRFVLSFYGLDHYVPFTGTHQIDKIFPPDQAPTITAGTQIRVEHMCQIVAGIPSDSHTSVIVTFTTR